MKILFPIVVLTAVTISAAQARSLRPVVKIDGPRIQLTDLGIDSAADLDLGPAPAPGQRRRIEKRQVEALIGAKKNLAPYWIVQTKKQILPCSVVVDAVKQAIASELSPGTAVESVACQRALILPPGKLQWTVKLTDRSRKAGNLSLAITVQAGKWPARRLSLIAHVDGTVFVLVATTAGKAGQTPGSENFQREQRQASSLPADAITSWEEISGKRFKTVVRRGDVLRSAHLAAIPLVRRGGFVTLTITMQGMRLVNRGIAKKDAGKGAIVAVFCPSSKRLIQARVVGPQRVTVDL